MQRACELPTEGILQFFCTNMPFSCFFNFSFLLNFRYDHNLGSNWLDWTLSSVAKLHKNSNLKLNVRHGVQNNVKFNILNDFLHFFSLLQQRTLFLKLNTSQRSHRRGHIRLSYITLTRLTYIQTCIHQI